VYYVHNGKIDFKSYRAARGEPPLLVNKVAARREKGGGGGSFSLLFSLSHSVHASCYSANNVSQIHEQTQRRQSAALKLLACQIT
jgi:hypothetical protein